MCLTTPLTYQNTRRNINYEGERLATVSLFDPGLQWIILRTMALERGQVISKHVGGKVPDNTKGMKDGVRQRIAEKGWIVVGQDLTPDFYLAIKQPAMFTAFLPTLVRRFPCFAILCKPLAIMLSASSVQRPAGPRKPRSAKVRSLIGHPLAITRYKSGRKPPRAKFRYDPQLSERL